MSPTLLHKLVRLTQEVPGADLNVILRIHRHTADQMAVVCISVEDSVCTAIAIEAPFPGPLTTLRSATEYVLTHHAHELIVSSVPLDAAVDASVAWLDAWEQRPPIAPCPCASVSR